LLRIRFEKAAEAYLRSLPLEHFMEATPQGTQREITLESLAVVKVQRRDLHVFNELLVQYTLEPDGEIQRVVPDNMVVLSDEPVQAVGSFDVPLQTVRPFWVLEYVSKASERKDYEENFDKYERELKVPYYLLFYPDTQDLTLYHHTGRRYVSVKPNEQGRYALPDLDLEMALLDGWVRYWFQGELVPLPADLVRQLGEVRRQLAEATRQAKKEKRRADALERRAEEEARRAEAERQGRLAAEQELARLRTELENMRARRKNGPE
jgi:Uma2 family endonuclease